MGTRAWKIPEGLRRRRDDEHGAEMVEFAIVVVLLIALLYGIITYGLILAAQATVTQAAADATRAGIVSSTTAVATAEAQACTDIGWMNKTCGTPCLQHHELHLQPQSHGRHHRLRVPNGLPVRQHQHLPQGHGLLQLRSTPLFPEMPGLGVITPSTISSTNVLQLSTPSS